MPVRHVVQCYTGTKVFIAGIKRGKRFREASIDIINSVGNYIYDILLEFHFPI